MAENKFINPYNFFPLEKEAPIKDSVKKGEYSGVINYTLTTKSKLFIPNISNDKALIDSTAYDKDEKIDNSGYHKSYEFFSYDDWSNEVTFKNNRQYNPVIPGSEIRGVVRSNYEMITNSCLSTINDDLVSKRTSEVFKAAIIRKTKNAEGKNVYKLLKARDCIYRGLKVGSKVEEDTGIYDKNDEFSRAEFNEMRTYSNLSYKEGEELKFELFERGPYAKPIAEKLSKIEGSYTGYLIKGEDGPEMAGKNNDIAIGTKHCAHIFIPLKEVIRDDVNLKLLENVLKFYDENSKGAYSEYKKELENFKKIDNSNEFFPVYYSEISKDIIFLSPAQFTREVTDKKISDLLKKHKSCSDVKCLCPTCRLFGMLGKSETVASRLRFTDLKAKESNVLEGPLTLNELASPRIQNLEFYMEKPDINAVFWTYEYWIDINGDVHPNDLSSELINGRKFYWHNLSNNYPNDVKHTIRNETIRPVKDKTNFDGKVYFNSLTKDELDTLIYTLTAGEGLNSAGKNGLKIGTGKPLGLGSVYVSKIDINLHDYNKYENNKLDKLYTNYVEPNLKDNIKHNYNLMTSFEFNKSGKKIAYPFITGLKDEEGFNWFTNNHKAYMFNKKFGENKITKSPNARKQMFYEFSLKAMMPELEHRTGNLKIAENFTSRPKNENGNYRNSGRNNNSGNGHKYNNNGHYKKPY